MKKLFIYYNFILLSIMTVLGFLGARNYAELVSAILFFPLNMYFLNLIIPRKKHILVLPKIEDKPQKMPAVVKSAEISTTTKRLDIDRRMFIKMIGGAGLSIFFLSIFSGKAQGAFFGSVPGPGTVALKDTTGAQVDPAIKHPTDGYKINQIDDSSPSYYGFTEKAGNWFIMKEDSSGNYRYAKGTSSFSTNWTGRAALSYDYYDVTF